MKFSHAQEGSRLVPFVIFFVLSLAAKDVSFAQGGISCSNKYTVTATDSANGLSSTLYGQNSVSPDPSCEYAAAGFGVSSCSSDFMFTDYQGAKVTFAAFLNSTGDSLGGWPNYKYDIYLNGAHYAEPGILNGLSITFDSIGIYQFQVTSLGSPTIDSDFEFYFVIMPRIKKVWVEATPICDSWTPPLSDNKYHFTVKTDPDIDSIMFPTRYYGSQTCSRIPGIDIRIDVSASNLVLDSLASPYFIQGAANFNSVAVNNDYNSAEWPGHYISPTYTGDIHDFTLPYDGGSGTTPTNGLNDFLAGGTYSGQPLYITATLTDGAGYHYATLLTPTNTALTVNAQVIIKSSALPATGPLSPTAPPFFPPQATATPVPSYNFYNYTVSGTEIWTPTNNPVTFMSGGGAVDTIRIQHNLNITGGASLTIENGMRIEFGPFADLTVQNNSSSSVAGGFLDVAHSTLTAYRGCDGLEESTWGGVIAYGNPTWWQGATTLPTVISPQGQAFFTYDTVSYADVAVQNGANASSSGGIIRSSQYNTFYNNKLAANIWPYHNVYSGTEYNAIDYFLISDFINDDNGWFPVTEAINANYIRNLTFQDCVFTNGTGANMPAGINGLDAGIAVNGSTFSNYDVGIESDAITATNTVSIVECTFNNNNFGIEAVGCVAPAIYGNIFNIPAYTGGGPVPYYTGSDVVILNDQNAGAIMESSTGYYIAHNTFQTVSSTYYANTTGTLEYNSGSDNNQVTDNTFKGLGVAMLSNFYNNGATSGLQYLCNTDTHTNYDISILGNLVADGGINPVQATSSATGTYDLPAGNVFATGSSWNIYDQQQYLVYNYSSGSGQAPVTYTTVTVAPVLVTSGAANCIAVAGSGSGPGGPYSVTFIEGGGYQNTDPALNFAVATANVNYYMTDTNGVPHRDSIYYWAAQMNSPYGDLLTANLLVQDSLIDSANTVYNGIVTKYSLTGPEANDFAQGRYLMDVLINQRENNSGLLSLSPTQVSSLQSVKANATMWAHARAEGWLYAYEGDAFTDTLLYPNAPADTAQQGQRTAPATPQPPGALANATQPNNQVYPNPVHDVLQVIYTAQSDQDITIQIQDISGKILITQSLQSGTPAGIDMSQLAPGMYLYRILEGANITMTGKVAKE